MTTKPDIPGLTRDGCRRVPSHNEATKITRQESEKVLISDDAGDIHFIKAPFLGAERSLCGKRLHSINTTRVKDKHCVTCVGCLIAMYNKR